VDLWYLICVIYLILQEILWHLNLVSIVTYPIPQPPQTGHANRLELSCISTKYANVTLWLKYFNVRQDFAASITWGYDVSCIHMTFELGCGVMGFATSILLWYLAMIQEMQEWPIDYYWIPKCRHWFFRIRPRACLSCREKTKVWIVFATCSTENL
jgi:hypothetical protein